jgi:hypothetical protein
MNWYLAKIVYQIICGDGYHAAQFDEQLRLIAAGSEMEAFQKANVMGKKEEETFCNAKSEIVQWKYINVAELYRLTELVDGAEIYSRITEADNADSYVHAVHQKAASLKEAFTHQLLQLT